MAKNLSIHSFKDFKDKAPEINSTSYDNVIIYVPW